MDLYIGESEEDGSYDFGNIVQFYNLDLIQKHAFHLKIQDHCRSKNIVKTLCMI